MAVPLSDDALATIEANSGGPTPGDVHALLDEVHRLRAGGAADLTDEHKAAIAAAAQAHTEVDFGLNTDLQVDAFVVALKLAGLVICQAADDLS